MSERQIVLLNEANRSLAEDPPDLDLARALLEKALKQVCLIMTRPQTTRARHRARCARTSLKKER